MISVHPLRYRQATMAKREREISSTLRNLKFMQRSTLKEEKKKKKIDEEPNGSFSSLGSVARKWYCFFCLYSCGHNRLGSSARALLGRMSFQSFNPSIEKMNEEAISGRETDASLTISSSNGGRMSFSEPKIEPSRETNGDLKRKQSE
ncbi:unnamed protein product [Brassica oleracea var. botrytis]